MIELSHKAAMSEYQRYVARLEEMKGWQEADLARNCFLMGEEVGELFAAVRRLERAQTDKREACVAHVGEEIVDVMNYLLAIANRLEIDLEAAFREKNRVNQTRTWT